MTKTKKEYIKELFERIELDGDLTNDEIKIALTSSDIKVLWEVFSSLSGKGNVDFEELYAYVQYGINVPFDIGSIIDGLYEVFAHAHLIKIERTLEVDLVDYRQEMLDRKNIIKDVLRTQYDDVFDNQAESQLEGYN